MVERTEPFSVSNAVAKGAERWVDVSMHETAAAAIDNHRPQPGTTCRSRKHERPAPVRKVDVPFSDLGDGHLVSPHLQPLHIELLRHHELVTRNQQVPGGAVCGGTSRRPHDRCRPNIEIQDHQVEANVRNRPIQDEAATTGQDIVDRVPGPCCRIREYRIDRTAVLRDSSNPSAASQLEIDVPVVTPRA